MPHRPIDQIRISGCLDQIETKANAFLDARTELRNVVPESFAKWGKGEPPGPFDTGSYRRLEQLVSPTRFGGMRAEEREVKEMVEEAAKTGRPAALFVLIDDLTRAVLEEYVNCVCSGIHPGAPARATGTFDNPTFHAAPARPPSAPVGNTRRNPDGTWSDSAGNVWHLSSSGVFQLKR